jgi:hypothetical protein
MANYSAHSRPARAAQDTHPDEAAQVITSAWPTKLLQIGHLLLHGGAGPITVTAWADKLAEARPAWVLTPVDPGFDGTPRPAGLDSARGLARLYVALLDQLGLADVS